MTPAALNTLAIANALIDLAIAWRILGRRDDPRTTGLARVIVAGAALLLTIALKLALLIPGVVNGWSIVWLLWIDLLVVPPLLGLRLITTRRSCATAPAKAIGWALVGLWPALGYANLIGPFDLRLERARVPLGAARAGSVPIRVGVLADLQTAQVGDYETAAVDRLIAESPDLILVPGDLYQGRDESFQRELPALRELLAKMTSVAPVVLVGGDCDSQEELSALTENSAVHRLVNEVLELRLGDRVVRILGLPNECLVEESAAAVRTFEGAPGEEDIRIVVAHRPGAFRLLREGTRVDLLVCGHTHGGQVVLPGFGPLLTYSAVPRRVAAGGLHALSGRTLYVSRGVGHEQRPAPRIRLFCPPEITLLTLDGAREDRPESR